MLYRSQLVDASILPLIQLLIWYPSHFSFVLKAFFIQAQAFLFLIELYQPLIELLRLLVRLFAWLLAPLWHAFPQEFVSVQQHPFQLLTFTL